MKTAQDLFGNYTFKKVGQPTSRRADLIQQIANALQVPFRNVFNEVWHLRDEWGCDVLQMILDDTLRASEKVEWRAKKCRELIDKSKGK